MASTKSNAMISRRWPPVSSHLGILACRDIARGQTVICHVYSFSIVVVTLQVRYDNYSSNALLVAKHSLLYSSNVEICGTSAKSV
jgi:hypothetical protein